MVRLTPKLNFAADYKPQPKFGWYNIGAGGGGALFHPKVSPHDKNVWMICCDMSETYITHDAGKHWRLLNLNGMVHDIAFDPFDPNVIYAGSWAVYRSDDKGLTWKLVLPTPLPGQPITPDTVAGYVIKIHADRKTPGHAYAGFHTRRLPHREPGGTLKLYASYDGAKSWTDMGDVEGSDVKCVTVAETGDGRFPCIFTDAGYFRCIDGKTVKQPLPQGFSLPLTLAESGIHPVTGRSVLYIACALSVDSSGAVHSGLYRSYDLGETWTQLTGFDADYPDTAISTRTIRDIGVSFFNPGRIYASVWRRPLILESMGFFGQMYDAAKRHPQAGQDMGPINRMGIMVSDDYGETWRWSVAMDLEHPQNAAVGWYENAYDVDWIGPPWYMDVDDRDPDRVFAALQGFAWISHNGGDNWEQVYTEQYEDGSWYGKGFESTTCYDVMFDPFDKDTMLITYTDNGMLKSTNGGKTWKHAIQGVPYAWINTCYKMVFDPEVPGLGWGVWTSVHDLPDHMMHRLHIAKIPPIAAGGVCVTEDSGSSWRPLTDLYKTNCIHTCIELDPTSPVGSRTLYMSAAPEGVFKSTDGGHTWQPKNNGFGINKNVFTLKRAKNGKLYAVTMKTLTDTDVPTDVRRAMWTGGVYVSADGAETWRELKLPPNVEIPQKIDFDPTNPDCIYLTAFPIQLDKELTAAVIPAKGTPMAGGGLYRSADGGETWENLFDERVQVYGIQTDPKKPAALYIVTAEFSAYRSLDGGKNWERIRGYHFKYGKNPILDPYNDDMMYITTFGGSVFYGPRAGGTERYDDIDGFTLPHKLSV